MQGYRRPQATKRCTATPIFPKSSGDTGSSAVLSPLDNVPTWLGHLKRDLTYDSDRLLEVEKSWRRGGDSNPRCRFQHNCLAGSPVQPLQHLSGWRQLQKCAQRCYIVGNGRASVKPTLSGPSVSPHGYHDVCGERDGIEFAK